MAMDERYLRMMADEILRQKLEKPGHIKSILGQRDRRTWLLSIYVEQLVRF